jgi:hypothetical protein
MAIFFIVLYFAFVLFFSFTKSISLNHPLFHVFKSLFPSWKFFDESNDTPVLLYKFLNETDWKIAVPVPERRWYNFIWNPEGNYYLAYHSHMQQLMGDLTEANEQETAAFQNHLSYKVTANFIQQLNLKSAYQFKVSAIKKNDSGFIITEDILISPEMNP